MRQTHIKSKVLSIALAFLIAVTMTPCWAIMTTGEVSATEYVAQVTDSSGAFIGENEGKYDTLQAAIDAAGTNVATITMLNNFVISNYNGLEIGDGKNVTLDLNGHSITKNTTGGMFTIQLGAKFTLKDSKGEGSITASKGMFYIKGEGTVLNICGGTFRASDGIVGFQNNNPQVKISGGVFDGALIYDNIERQISITGGTFTSNPAEYDIYEKGNPINYVANGYEAVANGTTPETWTVQKKQVTLYVDDDWNAEHVPTDKTWGVDAFNTIQDAVNKVNATQGLTTIHVAAGSYQGNVVLKQNNLKFTANNVDWYGNIAFIAENDATVTLDGIFDSGNDKILNIANLTISGFTFNDKAYPIYLMNSGGTSKNIVVENNTIDADVESSGNIYINSGVVEDVVVSGNTVTNNVGTYCMDIGGASGIIKNVTVSDNTFNGNYVGVFGQVLEDGVQMIQNTFNLKGYIWANSFSAQGDNIGKITLSQNKFSNNSVFGFNTVHTKKSDFVIEEGNTCNGNAITGFAESKADADIGTSSSYNKAVYYNGKLYFGDEPAASRTVNVTDTETLQQALDEAQKGDTIICAAGDYDTVYLRNNGTESNRIMEDVTVKAAEDATVNIVQFKYKTVSGKTLDIENLTIDGVNFNDSNHSGIQLDVNGKALRVNNLIVQNCSKTGDNRTASTEADGYDHAAFVDLTFSGNTEIDAPFAGDNNLICGYHNIKVLNNTINSVYQPIKFPNSGPLYGLTVSGNTFTNCEHNHLMLSTKTTGDVVITGNTINGQSGRFARISGAASDAKFTITGNIVNNAKIFEDEYGTDIVKITGDSGFTVEDNNNTWNEGSFSEDNKTWIANATPVAKIESEGKTKNFGTLAAAVEAATSGNTITMLENVELDNSIIIDKNIVLDLNGKNITVGDTWNGTSPTGQGIFYVKSGAKLIVNDTGDSGSIDSSNNEKVYSAIVMTIGDGQQNDPEKTASLEINGGLIKGYYYGIVTNGQRHNTEITVNGGTITGEDANDATSIYHPNQGKLIINGGTLIGYDGIAIKGGTPVTITGGEFVATGKQVMPIKPGKSGCNSVGSALYVEGNYGYGAGVTVRGGKFKTTDTTAPSVLSMFNTETEATISLEGGYYSSNVSDYVAPGYQCVETDETDSQKGISIEIYKFKVVKKAVAKIGATEYSSLADAVAAVPVGTETATTITMIADENIQGNVGVTIPKNKNITLELNGHVISSAAGEATTSAVITNYGTLTIQDWTDINKNGTGQGKITSGAVSPDGQEIPGYANNTILNRGGTLTINSGLIEVSTAEGRACYAVDNSSNSFGSAYFYMNGGKLYRESGTTVRQYACSSTDDNYVEITGGIIQNVNGTALQTQYQDGETSKAAKVTLKINGGCLLGNNDSYSWYDYNKYTTPANSFDNATYEFTGGYFDGYVWSYSNKKFMTGGYFKLEDDGLEDLKKCIADGYQLIDNPEYEEGTTDQTLVAYYPYMIGKKSVAEIGTGEGAKQYPTLEAAIAAVKDGEIIKILCDINNATGISVDTKKTFTIDFQGHEYTVNKPGAGSTGTTTQAFQLIKGQNVTFKNGIIRCNKDNLIPLDTSKTDNKNIKRIIQNYADLTLENMTIDGTNLCVNKVDRESVCPDDNTNRAVIESACGNVNIKGSTTIIDKMGTENGDVASINVNTWKGSYPNGTTVKVNTTGEIGTIRCITEGTETQTTNSKLEVENGKIKKIIEAENCVPNDVTVELKGGVYTVEPVTEYLCYGFSALSNTDEKTAEKYPYMVAEKQNQEVIVTTNSILIDNSGTEKADHIATLSGGGKYVQGTDIELIASEVENCDFVGWYAGKYESTATPVSDTLKYKLPAPDTDMKYVAVYKATSAKAEITVSKAGNASDKGIVSMTVDEQAAIEGKANVDVGAKAELTASIDSSKEGTAYFICWQDANSKAVLSTNTTYQTTVLKSQEVEAKFLNEGAAIVNFNDDEDNLIMAEMYAKSDSEKVIDVVAASKKGRPFNGWLNPLTNRPLENEEVRELIQTAADDATERAIAGGSALGTVNVKADYRNAAQYTVVLNVVNEDGTSIGTSLNISKDVGEAVVLTAVEREGGLQFKGFKKDGLTGDYITQSYKLTLNPDEAKSYTYYAVYGDPAGDINRLASITMGKAYDASTSVPKIGLTMSWALPNGAELKEAGFYYGYGSTLTVPSEEYKITTMLTDSEGSFTIDVNVTGIQDKEIYFAGYVRYKDKEGQEHLVVNGTENSTGGEENVTSLSGNKVTKVKYNGHDPAWKYDPNVTGQ